MCIFIYREHFFPIQYTVIKFLITLALLVLVVKFFDKSILRNCRLQLSYPRTAYIRKGWVVTQLIKLVIFTGFMGFIIEQVIFCLLCGKFGSYLFSFFGFFLCKTQLTKSYYHAVHQSNRAKLPTSSERKSSICD